MKSNTLRAFSVCAAIASAASAQNFQRQASMTGGGGPDRGKCTIEVVVDDVVQVEVRGTTATLRTVSGQPGQWRRFECNGVMPANPAGFRFQGVDGRGRQSLVRDPRQGGVAVVEIEDKQGGSEGYTFDLIWDSRGDGGGNQRDYRNDPNQPGQRYDPNQPQVGQRYDPNQPGYRPDDRNRDDRNRAVDRYRGGSDDGYRPNYRDSDYFHRYGHGFASEEAVRVCQQEISRQAMQRFRAADIHFDHTRLDDNPGREDWVTGNIDIHRGPRSESYNFACSVNFDNGRIRSAQLDPRPR